VLNKGNYEICDQTFLLLLLGFFFRMHIFQANQKNQHEVILPLVLKYTEQQKKRKFRKNTKFQNSNQSHVRKDDGKMM